MIESQRKKQKSETRKKLIEAAFVQLAKGLIAARTSDIASAAGVSHGTFFVHFPTREVFLQVVIEEFGVRVSKRLHELASKNGSLREVLEAHVDGLSEFEPFYSRLVSECSMLPEGVRNAMIMIQSAISFHISIAAEKEMQKGIIRSFPIHMLFNIWIGLIHYYLTNKDLFAPNESVLKRYGKELVNHYMTLISA